MRDLKQTVVIIIGLFAVLIVGLKVQSYIYPVSAQERKEITVTLNDKWHIEYPDDSLKVIFAGREFITDYNVYMFMGLLAMHSEMKYYEMECYADSVIGYILKWNYKTALSEIDSSKFVHRPPSFSGFIKFLDKRFAGEK